MNSTQNQVLLGSLIIVLIFVVIFFAKAFTTIDAGHRGVITHFGSVQMGKVQTEGIVWLNPISSSMTHYDVRTKKILDTSSASSKDLQSISTTIALNYKLKANSVDSLHQKIGRDYESIKIEPAIHESVKSITAKFTAEELIKLRPKVKRDIFNYLKSRLDKYYIIVEDLSIQDFKFSPKFNQAIERKQIAEQTAKTAKNELETIKMKAKQREAQANGEANAKLALAKAEAEANLLLQKSLTPTIIELKRIEKWNGKLPVYQATKSSGIMLQMPNKNK